MRNNSKEEILNQVKEVLKIEAEGILNLVDRIDDNFFKIVNLIYKSLGRVVVAGIGKSGLVGQKIVATLNSTGTKAIFLHPVEAVHGDLGMVCDDDIFIALSNSGETEELNRLLPSIKNIGCPIVAFTGNSTSTLANHSDIIINVHVDREACPLGLAPTASTTALMAVGDALAVALINKRKFKTSDFKKFHPGGALGHRLSMKVKDIMLSGAYIPKVYENISLEEAVKEINRLSVGAAFIVKKDDTLIGIITDGDIRRFITSNKTISGFMVEDVMSINPRCVNEDTPAYDALDIMESHQITILPITGANGKIQGILHLHDILGKGEFKFSPTI
ncbi:MAG: KpsF/GutQ family sugar-phosphate isomerase [Desulfobacterales bacterium]|nr:KpsF/GutQ family sugar-phosphate isomerase [Desulfobacterales bacterium]MBF0398774.1 KpsF/GutQ family sugar-phosphate isomerase [Desulfobacterales bacterium]